MIGTVLGYVLSLKFGGGLVVGALGHKTLAALWAKYFPKAAQAAQSIATKV